MPLAAPAGAPPSPQAAAAAFPQYANDDGPSAYITPSVTPDGAVLDTGGSTGGATPVATLDATAYAVPLGPDGMPVAGVGVAATVNPTPGVVATGTAQTNTTTGPSAAAQVQAGTPDGPRLVGTAQTGNGTDKATLDARTGDASNGAGVGVTTERGGSVVVDAAGTDEGMNTRIEAGIDGIGTVDPSGRVKFSNQIALDQMQGEMSGEMTNIGTPQMQGQGSAGVTIPVGNGSVKGAGTITHDSKNGTVAGAEVSATIPAGPVVITPSASTNTAGDHQVGIGVTLPNEAPKPAPAPVPAGPPSF